MDKTTDTEERLTIDQILARLGDAMPLGYEPELNGKKIDLRSVAASLAQAFGLSADAVTLGLTAERRRAM